MTDRAPGRASLAIALGLLALAGPALAACGDAPIAPAPTAVRGAGDVVSEDRTAGDIERVSVGAGITVRMRTGAKTAVTIEGEQNVIPLVTTTTRDGQLIVNVPSPGYTSVVPVTLTVVAPAITSVTLSAGATGTLEAATRALRVDLSAGAHLTGTGRVERLTLVASSGGAADLGALAAGTASVTMSGGSSATLAVETAITGDASGGATVTLTTRPSTVTVTTSSGASVRGG